jgi:CxxC motif-containing protein (DUF1111 family)
MKPRPGAARAAWLAARAFSNPSTSLTLARQLDFRVGDGISMLFRVSVPPRTEAERLAIEEGRQTVVPEPTYGAQLQGFATQGQSAEARVRITVEDQPVALHEGPVVRLQKPVYRFWPLARVSVEVPANPGLRVRTGKRIAPEARRPQGAPRRDVVERWCPPCGGRSEPIVEGVRG